MDLSIYVFAGVFWNLFCLEKYVGLLKTWQIAKYSLHNTLLMFVLTSRYVAVQSEAVPLPVGPDAGAAFADLDMCERIKVGIRSLLRRK